MKRINFEIDENEYKKIKIYCANNEISIKRFFENASRLMFGGKYIKVGGFGNEQSE